MIMTNDLTIRQHTNRCTEPGEKDGLRQSAEWVVGIDIDNPGKVDHHAHSRVGRNTIQCNEQIN